MRNLIENEFDLHLNELVIKIHFHMKGFSLGLVLKQRQRELGNGLFAVGTLLKITTTVITISDSTHVLVGEHHNSKK